MVEEFQMRTSKRKSFYIALDFISGTYPVRVSGENHFSQHKTIDEAVEFLFDKYGTDINYSFY